MTALAKELDRRLQLLDPEAAARLEKLVRQCLDAVELREEEPVHSRAFITRTHDFQFKPGIDLTKLGQLADDF